MKWMEEDIDRLIVINEANPEAIWDYAVPMVKVGFDVAALYPNLDAKQSSKMVYKAIMETDLKW